MAHAGIVAKLVKHVSAGGGCKLSLALAFALASAALPAKTIRVDDSDHDRDLTQTEANELIASDEDLVKTGGGRLVISMSLAGYKGEIRVEEGYLFTTNGLAFGDTDKGTIVSPGATIEFKNDNDALRFGKEQFTISGLGVDGCGALRHVGTVKDQWFAVFEKVKLAGRTRVGSKPTSTNGYKRWDFRSCTLDMQGYTLEVAGGFGLCNSSVVSPGDIVVTNVAGIVSSTLYFEGEVKLNGSSANTLVVSTNTYFSSQNFTPAVPWSVVFDGCSCNEQNSQSSWTARTCFNGPVTITENGVKFNGGASKHWSFAGDVTVNGPITTANNIQLAVIQTADDTAGDRMAVLKAIREHVVPAKLDTNIKTVLYTTAGSVAQPIVSGGDYGMEDLAFALRGNAAVKFTGEQDMTHYYQDGGYVKLDGAGNTHSFTNMAVSGNATLDISGAGMVTVHTNAAAFGATYPDMAKLNVSNAIFTTNWVGMVPTVFRPMSFGACPDSSAKFYSSGYANSRGILEIGDGGFVTNMLWAGYVPSSLYSDARSTCHGSVFIRGGELRTFQVNWQYNFVGTGCSGFIEVSGGKLSSTGLFYLGGGARGRGLLYQMGGNVLFESGLTMGQYSNSIENYGKGVYYLKGGSTSMWGPLVMGKTKWDTGNKGSQDQVTIAGGSMSIDNGIDLAGEPYARSMLNLNGGTLLANFAQVLTNELQTQMATGDFRELADTFAWVNFNGGTFRRRSSTKDVVQKRAAYKAGSFFFGEPSRLRVTSFGRGAIFDTYGQTVSLDHSVGGPSGQGLASLALPEGTTIPDWAFAGAPSIEISGDGTGAAAVAEYDSVNGRVTGFTVTAPGFDYTTITAKLARGGYTNEIPLVCTLAAPVPGGLTKVGSGTLNMNVANTYGGATRVEKGVLNVRHADAIPTGSNLEIAGGTLDGGGFEKAYGAITATSGTLQNVAGTFTSLEKTGPGSFTLDAPIATPGTLEVKEGTFALRPKQPGLVCGEKRFGTKEASEASGAWSTMTPLTGLGVDLEPTLLCTNTSSGYYEEYHVVGYSGYVWNREQTTKTWTFAYSFDDSFWIMVDDVSVPSTKCSTAKWGALWLANVELTPGPHSFRLYGKNAIDSGGAITRGNVSGCINWRTDIIGIAYDPNGNNSTNGNDYVHMVDPGDGSLFTTAKNDEPTFGALKMWPGTTLDLMGCNYVFTNELLVAQSVFADPIQVEGSLVFGQGARVTVEELATLDEDAAPYTILRTSRGVSGEFPNLGRIWFLKRSPDGKDLMLDVIRGTVLYFR